MISPRNLTAVLLATSYLLLLATGCGWKPAAAVSTPEKISTVPGMPPVVNPGNLYSEAGPNQLSPTVSDALPRVYVPNVKSNDVYVIDPVKYEVVDHFTVGKNPQHVVPSWDLKTLWVANNAEKR